MDFGFAILCVFILTAVLAGETVIHIFQIVKPGQALANTGRASCSESSFL